MLTADIQAEVTAIGDALKLVYDPEAGNKGGELGKGIYVDIIRDVDLLQAVPDARVDADCSVPT